MLGSLALATAALIGFVWLRGQRQPPPPADYEKLFALSPHPMYVYEVASLRFMAVNDAMVRRHGYGRDELLTMTLADIRPPEDVPAMQAMTREAQKSGSVSVPGIWRHRRKDGTVFNVRVSGHDITYAGRPSRMVQVIDVSAEVALQAEREQMIARLQHSREWLATAINAGRIALWERDLIAHTLVLGGRWADILGTTAQAFGPVTEE
ncbi:MAG TPA: PAS domain S-box protein, partial [Rhizobacter sp.]|nr:PAS domain S-box protein [Rhizobacter sp.]